MFFITVGSICVFMLPFKRKHEAIGLTLIALSIYLVVNFLHSEWNARIQLSAHVFLVSVASVGWVILASMVYKNFQPTLISSE